MTVFWPQEVDWPSAAFLLELREKAYACTVATLADPHPDLEIDEESLRGHRLQDLVIEFRGLSIRLDAGRRAHYYRVMHNIGPEPQNAPMLPLFVYEVEFSPEGEFWDEFFRRF